MKKIAVFILLFMGIIWFYANSLIGVNPKAKEYLKTLDKELSKKTIPPIILSLVEDVGLLIITC